MCCQREVTLDGVRKASNILFKIIAVGGDRLEAMLLGNKGQGSFKALGWATERVLGDIVQRLVNMIKQSVFSNFRSLKLAPIFPQKLRGVLIFLDNYILGRWLPNPWERPFWVEKLVRRWEKTFISKEQRKNLQFSVFFLM